MRDLDFLAKQLIGPRRCDPMDRERLAEIAHRKRCAKHKGRNHWRNWERRRMAREKAADGKAKADRSRHARERYIDEVRAFWLGLRPDHP